jgi:protein-disulfide isomerase
MSLHPDREELMAWRDDEVTADRAGVIAAHVATCAVCRDFTASLAVVSQRVSRWTVEPASFERPQTPAPIAAPAARRPLRRATMLWVAAAVVLVAIVTTVRVDCAPAPACDLSSVHLKFLPNRATAIPDQRVGAAAASPFEAEWLSRRRLPIQPAPGAKVTVVIFIDWQCPVCRAADRAYGEVFADFERRMPGAVAVEWRDYPLHMRCNPDVPNEMHPAACEAAVAVRLAREHKTADAMISWLFDHQESLTPDSVRAAAAAVGQIPDFASRYTPVLASVGRDVAEGHGLGVHGTPTCFINGILARNNNGQTLFSPDEVRRAIETELKHAK